MKDLIHAGMKFLDHYRYSAGAIILAIAIIGVLVGCEAQTVSIIDPSQKVTAQGLQIEAAKIQGDLASEKAAIDAAIAEYNGRIETFNQQIEAAQSDIEKKEAVRAELLQIGGAVATSVAEGSVNPASLIGTGITALSLALGIGASADNRRKDAKIQSLKKFGEPATQPS